MLHTNHRKNFIFIYDNIINNTGFEAMKQILKVILILLIIFNLIIASLLILDIQTFIPPKTTVRINILDMNSEALKLETIVNVDNSNVFEISIQNFEVVSRTQYGEEIGRIMIPGGTIQGGTNKTFTSEDNFILTNQNIALLQNTLTARVSLKFLGLIEKSIPLEIDIETSIEALVEQIKQPTITMHTELTEIYQEGINFTSTIMIYNPTHLLYNIEEIYFNIENDQGENLGKITLTGNRIEPLHSITLISDGTILFDAFDAQRIWLKLFGIAGVQIAGLYKTINITADTSFSIPNIKEFIFGNEPIDFNIRVKFKLTLRGLICKVGFQMYNPSNITILAEDLICSVLRQDGEIYSEYGQNYMEHCTINPHQQICVQTNITIRYLDIIRIGKGRLRPDWLILRVDGNLYIAGTSQVVPISLNAYADPYIFFYRV